MLDQTLPGGRSSLTLALTSSWAEEFKKGGGKGGVSSERGVIRREDLSLLKRGSS